jgi:hypothetical protein
VAHIKFDEDSAKNYAMSCTSNYAAECSFVAGARWQYRQDQIEMKKLVDVLLLIAHFIPEEDAGYAIVRAQEALEEYYGDD